MTINVVPLVKNKCGDLTDVNNYRATALCNIDTKVKRSYYRRSLCIITVIPHHFALLLLNRQLITTSVGAVMCLYVSLTSRRCSTKSTIGSFSANLLMMALIAVLY